MADPEVVDLPFSIHCRHCEGELDLITGSFPPYRHRDARFGHGHVPELKPLDPLLRPDIEAIRKLDLGEEASQRIGELADYIVQVEGLSLLTRTVITAPLPSESSTVVPFR